MNMVNNTIVERETNKVVKKAHKLPKQCGNCKLVGHFARTCPEIRCYYCGKLGHVRKVCLHRFLMKSNTNEKRLMQNWATRLRMLPSLAQSVSPATNGVSSGMMYKSSSHQFLATSLEMSFTLNRDIEHSRIEAMSQSLCLNQLETCIKGQITLEKIENASFSLYPKQKELLINQEINNSFKEQKQLFDRTHSNVMLLKSRFRVVLKKVDLRQERSLKLRFKHWQSVANRDFRRQIYEEFCNNYYLVPNEVSKQYGTGLFLALIHAIAKPKDSYLCKTLKAIICKSLDCDEHLKNKYKQSNQDQKVVINYSLVYFSKFLNAKIIYLDDDNEDYTAFGDSDDLRSVVVLKEGQVWNAMVEEEDVDYSPWKDKVKEIYREYQKGIGRG